MLKCRTLRRLCSITKKPYRSCNVSVRTVKKSKATIIPMVSEKGEPAFGRIATVPQTSQISGDHALGDVKAEFQ